MPKSVKEIKKDREKGNGGGLRDGCSAQISAYDFQQRGILQGGLTGWSKCLTPWLMWRGLVGYMKGLVNHHSSCVPLIPHTPCPARYAPRILQPDPVQESSGWKTGSMDGWLLLTQTAPPIRIHTHTHTHPLSRQQNALR